MLTIVKRSVIAIVVVICAYEAIQFWAVRQVFQSFAVCATERNSAGRRAGLSEEEARIEMEAVVVCVDRRNGFLARLFFNKDEIVRSLRNETS